MTKLERWADTCRRVRKKAVKLGRVVAAVTACPDQAHDGQWEIVVGYPVDSSVTHDRVFRRRADAMAFAAGLETNGGQPCSQ